MAGLDHLVDRLHILEFSMKSLIEWARDWHISTEALRDLFAEPPLPAREGNEASVQADARRFATRMGGRLWRNNLGAGKLENGSFIRWGLCNDSTLLNQHIKSADLIGILPRRIVQADVGDTIGQFWSVECKAPGWRPHAMDTRDQAQRRWEIMIQSMGGRAQYTTGEPL